mmetsp:Transcript_64290/g.139913  ORF Transcript_64290/g.139913 Transcript_64290/m.139913 type:complete len:217 (+) Transcript_64290:617-1267(+)
MLNGHKPNLELLELLPRDGTCCSHHRAAYSLSLHGFLESGESRLHELQCCRVAEATGVARTNDSNGMPAVLSVAVRGFLLIWSIGGSSSGCRTGHDVHCPLNLGQMFLKERLDFLFEPRSSDGHRVGLNLLLAATLIPLLGHGRLHPEVAPVLKVADSLLELAGYGGFLIPQPLEEGIQSLRRGLRPSAEAAHVALELLDLLREARVSRDPGEAVL